MALTCSKHDPAYGKPIKLIGREMGLKPSSETAAEQSAMILILLTRSESFHQTLCKPTSHTLAASGALSHVVEKNKNDSGKSHSMML